MQAIEPSLRELLPIEMATIAVIDDQTRGADLRAWVGCRGEDVLLLVTRLDTGEVLEDSLSVPDRAAPGTARAVALALSELVTIARPPPVVPEVIPPWLVHGAFVVRAGVGDGPWMGGLAVEASHALRPFMRVFFGAEWATGAHGTALGDIVATSLTADAAASFGYAHRGAWLGLDVGARVGTVLWNGRPSSPDVLGPRDATPFFGLFGRLGAEASLTRALRVRAAVELGAVVAGSRGLAIDEGPAMPMTEATGIDRLWCGLSLGVSFAP
jgi:hypothetical protein